MLIQPSYRREVGEFKNDLRMISREVKKMAQAARYFSWRGKNKVLRALGVQRGEIGIDLQNIKPQMKQELD